MLMSPLARPVDYNSDEEIPSLSLGKSRSPPGSNGDGSTIVHLGLPARFVHERYWYQLSHVVIRECTLTPSGLNSSFHYQAKGIRVPYLEEKVRRQ